MLTKIFDTFQELENSVRAEERKANQINKRNLKTKSNPSPLPIIEPPSPKHSVKYSSKIGTESYPEIAIELYKNSLVEIAREVLVLEPVTKCSTENATIAPPEPKDQSQATVVTKTSPEIVTNIVNLVPAINDRCCWRSTKSSI